MSSFSEIVGQRRKSLNSRLERTDFLTQKGKPRGSLAAALCAHEGVTERSPGAAPDALIQGLINRLPTPDSIWSPSERARWLRTAESIFDLVYKVGDTSRAEARLPSTTNTPVTLLSGDERKKAQAVSRQNEDA